MTLSCPFRCLARKSLAASALLCAALLAVSAVQAKAPPQVAVNAKTYNGYARTTLPDGSLRPEYCTFAEGGRWNYGNAPSIDATPFDRIVTLIAGTLRSRQYLPATDANPADLMIVVYWGSTQGDDDGEYSHELTNGSGVRANTLAPPTRQPSMNGAKVGSQTGLQAAVSMDMLEQEQRDLNDARNARILGYYDDFLYGKEMLGNGFSRGQDALTEIESNRYFIVLKAYDARLATKEKTLKLMWEARFSIYQRGYDFTEQSPAMAEVASRYFGRDTKGLVRADPREGSVRVGPATVIPSDPTGRTPP